MQSNLWQYIVVFILLAGTIVWILVNLFGKKHRNRTTRCSGCSLADACGQKDDQGRGKALYKTVRITDEDDLPACCRTKKGHKDWDKK